MDFAGLTERQRMIYSFIRSTIEERGSAPSVRDIARAFGMRHPGYVMQELKLLEGRGLIKRMDAYARIWQERNERQSLRIRVRELEDTVDKLKMDNEVMEQHIKDIKEEKYCPDCLRRRTEWY